MRIPTPQDLDSWVVPTMMTLSTLGGAAGAFLVLDQGLDPHPTATLVAAVIAGFLSWCFTALVITIPVTALFFVAQVVSGLFHGFSRRDQRSRFRRTASAH